MRVIAGTARGMPLKAPKGLVTRPMADKVKESLFMVLSNMGAIKGRVLDLFAGSGALGIEALSRGAAWADFVDVGHNQVAVIRKNLEATGFAERARVVRSRVEAFLARRSSDVEPYDLVFVDPPYDDPILERVLLLLSRSGIVSGDSVVAVGHSPRHALRERYDGLERLLSRCLGDSCYSIYRYRIPETGG
jgi:16S rRNA (guanine966-N2)-methyltransferase